MQFNWWNTEILKTNGNRLSSSTNSEVMNIFYAAASNDNAWTNKIHDI